jgi:hypothetical protein
MYVIVIKNSGLTDRIVGIWTELDDAEDWGRERSYADRFTVCPIDIVNDGRAARVPHYGGNVRVIRDITIKKDGLI